LASRSSDTWIVVALCAVAYLYSFPYHPKIGNPNEKLRVYMTASLVEEGELAVNTMRKRWGWVNDAAKRDGKYYSVKAPGTSFLGVPGYAAVVALTPEGEKPNLHRATWVLRVTASILPILFFLFFFHRFLRRSVFRMWTADAVVLSLALGSGFFASTMLFASHATAGACVGGALMWLVGAQQRGHITRRAAFFAGLLTAGVTWFEYHGLVASLALSAFALVAVRPTVRLLPFAVGGILPALSMMWFQWRAFGNPLTPGHKLLENQSLVKDHQAGFWGISEIHWEALGGLTFEPGFGLFPMTPIFLLAFPGFFFLVRSRRWKGAAWTALAATLLTWMLISTMGLWHGGWTVGPRYLVLCMPLIAWGAVAGLDQLALKRPALALGVALGSLATALITSGIASAWYPHTPRNITNPVTQLFVPALRDGYAPYNLLNFVGLWGTLSMAPLLLVAIAALWLASRRFEERRRRVALVAVAVFAVSMAPQLIPWNHKGDDAVAHSLRNWSPPGNDAAALLEARRGAEGDSVELLDKLQVVYEREHRSKELGRVKKARKALQKGAEG